MSLHVACHIFRSSDVGIDQIAIGLPTQQRLARGDGVCGFAGDSRRHVCHRRVQAVIINTAIDQSPLFSRVRIDEAPGKK